MLISNPSLVGATDRAGRRTIAIACQPRKRDFLRILFGNYVPTLRVYRDSPGEHHHPTFLFGYAPEVYSSGTVSPEGIEEEMTKLREMAGVPSPV